MALFSLRSFVLLGVGVEALVYPWPRETNTPTFPLDAQAPKPTAPAGLHHFLKRQNNDQTVLVAPDNTCGYVSGQSAAAYTCVGTTNRCVFVTAFDGGYGAAGCCNNFECGFRVACIDYAQLQSSSCDSSCQSDTFTEKCTASGIPYCNTVEFAGGVTDYFCNSLPVSTAQLALTTYPGQVGRTFEQTVLADTSTRPRRSSTATPSHTGAPTTSSTPAPSTGSSTPVGAIVGGVVGGVAVLALIAFGIFFIRRGKKKDPATPSTAPEIVQHQPPSPFPNPSPGPNTLSPSAGPNLSPSPASSAAGAATMVPGSKPGHQSVASSYNPPYSPSGFGNVPPSDHPSPQPQLHQQQQQYQNYPAQPGQAWDQQYSGHPQHQHQQQPGYDQHGGYNPHLSGQSYQSVPGSGVSSWTPQQQPHPGAYEPGVQGGGPVEMDGQGRPGRAYELG